MAGFNLADILAQAGEMQSIIRGDTKKTEQTQEQTQALREEQVQAAQSMVGLSVDQARIEGKQKLQLEARKKATMDTFGVDILDPENRIAYLAREQAAAVDETIANSKRAAELRNTSLYDSPLEYLMARPFASRNDLAAENATQRAVVIDKALDDLNNQVQSTVKTQAAIQEAWTVDQQTNHLSQIALTAADKVRQLQINQNTAYTNDLKVLRDMGAEDIKNSTNAYTLKRQAEQFDAIRAEHRAALEARKSTKKADAANLEEYMRMYNLGAKELGKQTFTDPAQFTALLKYNKDMVEAVVTKGSERGIDVNNPDAQTVPSYVARSAGESVMVLAQVGGTLPTSAERTAAYLAETRSLTGQKLTKEQGGKKITGDQMVGGINSSIYGSVTADEKGNKVTTSGSLAQMQQNVENDLNGGRTKNIYRAPDVATVAAATPRLTQEKWWKEIIQPASLTAPSPTGDQVMKQAKLALQSGTLTPEEAADGISTYFKAATLINITNEQYQRVGLPTPKAYPVIVDKGPSYFMPGARRIGSIDLMDDKKVLQNLMATTPQRVNFNK
jgi:hypothetical protein